MPRTPRLASAASAPTPPHPRPRLLPSGARAQSLFELKTANLSWPYLRPDENPNPGCTPFFVANETQEAYDVAAIWVIQVTLDGSLIGYLADNSIFNSTTSCDQVAAIGLNTVTKEPEIRATSFLTSSGYSLGWFGLEGEEIEFRYWNGEEEKEYLVHEKFIMGKSHSDENEQGSHDSSIGPKILELAEIIPVCGCQVGCTHWKFPDNHIAAGLGWQDLFANTEDQCVENEGSCETTAFPGNLFLEAIVKCQTGKDNSPSANCYTPCPLPRPSGPSPPSSLPSPSPPPPSPSQPPPSPRPLPPSPSPPPPSRSPPSPSPPPP